MSTTIESIIDEMREWNAALTISVFRDANDAAVGAVIVVDGQPETDQVVTAVEAVEKSWQAGTPSEDT
jgi:hypothetical protein